MSKRWLVKPWRFAGTGFARNEKDAVPTSGYRVLPTAANMASGSGIGTIGGWEVLAYPDKSPDAALHGRRAARA
jgi:hypothetical protein